MAQFIVIHANTSGDDQSPDFDVLWSGRCHDPRPHVEQCARELITQHAGSIRAAMAFEEPIPEGGTGWALAWQVGGPPQVTVTEHVTRTESGYLGWYVTHEVLPRGHVMAMQIAPAPTPVPRPTFAQVLAAPRSFAPPAVGPMCTDGPTPWTKEDTARVQQVNAEVIAELRARLADRAQRQQRTKQKEA